MFCELLVIRYCAHEYERTKEMGTAALAYKCMEVAYMKVIYSSHATATKDVNELQSSLQTGGCGSLYFRFCIERGCLTIT